MLNTYPGYGETRLSGSFWEIALRLPGRYEDNCETMQPSH